MHLNHITNIFFKWKIKKEAHRGGVGDGAARAIDGGQEGDGTTLYKTTNYTLIWAQNAYKTNEIPNLGISSNTLQAPPKSNLLNLHEMS